MFLNNKYTRLYYKLIEKASLNTKKPGDGKHKHHIIPRCIGGTNDVSNMVICTRKQHRVCHRLLIKMTEGNSKWKLMHAYKLFDKSYDLSDSPFMSKMTKEKAIKGAQTRRRKGSYRTGKQNNFSNPNIVKRVKERMTLNNPMKDERQKERMRLHNNNPKTFNIKIGDNIFPSLNAAARYYNTTPHLIKRDYNPQRLPNS